MRRSVALLALGVLVPVVAVTACGGGDKDSPAANASDTKTEVVPGAGQAFVTGIIRRFAADDARTGAPLAAPFTLSALERGSGNATIENALVAGKRTTISWATGTPLPITGAGGLDVGAAHVDVDSAGITWHLDGAARSFVPGTYRAGAPVAIGSVGLAVPRDSVEFDADERTLITTRGGVIVHRNPSEIKLEGPGSLNITGQLQVRTPSGKHAAGTVTFTDGPFTATLTPAGTQVRLESVVQGPVSSS